MDFYWKIASRTGEMSEGEDNFPSPEQKDSANTFDLSLFEDCAIQAPYGQNIFSKKISLSVPDGHRLVFKRRVRMDLCDGEEHRTHTYIIAFEKVN
jgi:hypothetical protein